MQHSFLLREQDGAPFPRDVTQRVLPLGALVVYVAVVLDVIVFLELEQGVYGLFWFLWLFHFKSANVHDCCRPPLLPTL